MRITGEIDRLRHRVETIDPEDPRLVTTRCGKQMAFVGSKRPGRITDCPACDGKAVPA